jgi:hypothetical protein
MDERLAGHAAGEGIYHVSIGDVGELIVLLREALDVFSKHLVGPLPALRRSHEFPGRVYVPWK